MYIRAYRNTVDLWCDHSHVNANLLALLTFEGHVSLSTSNKYLNLFHG